MFFYGHIERQIDYLLLVMKINGNRRNCMPIEKFLEEELLETNEVYLTNILNFLSLK